MKNKETQILGGNIPRVLLALIYPVVLSGFLEISYNLADSFFLGRVSETALTAGSIGSNIIMIGLNLSMGFAIGGGIYIGQSIGRGEKHIVNTIIVNIMLSVIVLGTFLATIALTFLPNFIALMGVKSEALTASCMEYTSVILMILPLSLIISSYIAIRRSQGQLIKPIILTVLSLMLNIVLNYTSVFVLEAGILGVAYATVIAKVVLVLYIAWDLFLNKNVLPIQNKDMKVNWKIIADVAKIGLPISVASAVVTLGFSAMTRIASEFGEGFLTIHAVAQKVNHIIFMVSGSMGAAFAVFVSMNYGAKNFDRIKKAIRVMLSYGVIWSVLSVLMVFLLGPYIIRFFTTNEAIIDDIQRYMKVLAFANVTWAPYAISSKLVESCGRTLGVMIMNITRFWLMRVPLAYYLSQNTPLEQYGIAIATTVSLAISLVLIWTYYHTRIKKTFINEHEPSLVCCSQT